MAKKTKKCAFCGEEYESNDKSVVLFKASIEGSDVRICSHCIERCTALYNEKIAKQKQKELSGTVIEMTPQRIFELLNEYVLDQDQAMKKVARGYYDHLKRLKRNDLDPEAQTKLRVDKANMLYLGPTGVGKTESVRALASFLEVPYTIADASSLTASGYVGRDCQDILKDLLDAAEGDLEKAQRGVIFIDEVDKIKKTSGGKNGKDVGGEAVQQGLLRLIEGGTHKVVKNRQTDSTIDFNTDNVLFLVGGAFVGIEKIIAKRLNQDSGKSTVGFGATLVKEQEQSYNDLIVHVKPEDLIEFGLIPEFVGRVPVIAPFKELSVETLVDILTEPKHAMVKQYKEMFKFESNVDLEFTDVALENIAKKAKEKKTGARGLRTVLEEVLEDVGFEYPSIKGLTKVIIHDDLSHEYIVEKEEVVSDLLADAADEE